MFQTIRILTYLIMYFECVLAVIIIIALKGMFLQVKQLPHLWHLSKLDFVSKLLIYVYV